MGVPKSLGKSRHKHHPKVRGPVSGNLVGILDGCVLHLPMDEGFGDTVHDRSGYGNHGTIYGASWVWDSKLCRYVLYFDGVDDYVEIPDSPELRFSDTVTIFASINTLSTSEQRILRKSTISASARSYMLLIDDGPRGWFYLYFSDGSNTSTNILTAIFDTDEWHTITATFDGIARIYLDGSLQSEEDHTGKTINEVSDPVTIGHGPRRIFKGRISCIVLLTPFLSSEDVLLLSLHLPLAFPHIKGRLFLYSVR